MATKSTTTKKATVKEEACKCENCNCANNECLLKAMFYTLICIFVCAFISTVFTIILTINYYNNNKDTRNTDYSNTSNSGNNGSGNGTSTNTGNDETEYDVSRFTEITAAQLIELWNGEEKSFIYIGRSTCGYCVKFLPYLNQAIDEFGIKAYYYNTDTLDEESYYAIAGLNEWMGNNFGATPMVIVVQGGDIVSAENNSQGWVGYADYDTFKAYLQGLGY